MFTQNEKIIKRACDILLVLLILVVAVGNMPKPVQAAAPDLAQFTSSGHALGFTANGIYAATGTHALRVDFVNANNVQPLADSPAGIDDKTAPLHRVTYSDLWPGISLAYDAPAGTILRSTYTLQPGADPGNIRLRYNAPLTLNTNGTLGIAFETGVMTESAPIAWQEISGKRVSVDVRFFLSPEKNAQTVAFVVGAYDPRHALTIDPSLTWNTFLGGSTDDFSHSLVLDGNGNIYVSGNSNAAWSCPTNCTARPYTGEDDAFVAKLDGASGALIWNTFLGGNKLDDSMGVTVDGNGNVYVSGFSTETWGSPLRGFGGGDTDGFVAKLDTASGALTWSTFLGGTGADRGWGIAVDSGGNIYVTGNSAAAWSCSPTDCTVRAFGGIEDAFTTKLASSGDVVWVTFLGGSGTDVGYGNTVDGNGNIYVTGYSTETWGNPLREFGGGISDGFTSKLDGTSGALTWNTFLGGSAEDIGYSIAVDGNDNVYVTGRSNTTWSSPLREFGGGDADGFAAKLESASGALTWNTFLGGSGYDFGFGITVDGMGNVYLTGASNEAWGAPLQGFSGNDDGFATKLAPSGTLAWNTFLGGSGADRSYSIAVFGEDENVYVSGYSDANWGNPLRVYTGGQDAFAAKVDVTLPLVSSILCASPNPTASANVNYTVTFSVPVTDVDTGDFSLTTTGSISGASVTGVSGSDATRTVTVATGTGSGTLRLDIPATATITNLTGAPLSGLPYTSGQIYTILQITTFRSTGAQDGWVLETGERTNKGGTLNNTATTLRLGDDKTKKQYRSILSFSTGTSLPDNAVITKVTLKVRRQSIVGSGNPVSLFKGFMVDIRKGFFGTATLQTSDFYATASKTYGPFVTALSGGWYSIDLTPEKAYINKMSTLSGLTQIRLRFKLDDNNNTVANYLSLFSGNAPLASRPTLIIEYYVP